MPPSRDQNAPCGSPVLRNYKVPSSNSKMVLCAAHVGGRAMSTKLKNQKLGQKPDDHVQGSPLVQADDGSSRGTLEEIRPTLPDIHLPSLRCHAIEDMVRLDTTSSWWRFLRCLFCGSKCTIPLTGTKPYSILQICPISPSLSYKKASAY